tara:strand:+ start:2603 stop:3268 length:666 start_codon:yes stop_codon:yes gene_type:complete
MAYTPVTMPAGAILATNPAGQGVQDNLDKMKDYVDGGVAAADIAADGWVESKHIMRGHYNPIVNMHSFVSGLNGGYTSNENEFSFVADGPTARGAPDDPEQTTFSNTGTSFFLRGTADVLFQFTAYPITPSVQVLAESPLARASVYIDGVRAFQTQVATRHIYDGHQLSDFWLPHNWNVWSGFFVSSGLGQGEHTITIRGETEGRYSYLMNFSVSLEAFYR